MRQLLREQLQEVRDPLSRGHIECLLEAEPWLIDGWCNVLSDVWCSGSVLGESDAELHVAPDYFCLKDEHGYSDLQREHAMNLLVMEYLCQRPPVALTKAIASVAIEMQEQHGDWIDDEQERSEPMADMDDWRARRAEMVTELVGLARLVDAASVAGHRAPPDAVERMTELVLGVYE